jgi:hypothetical protein
MKRTPLILWLVLLALVAGVRAQKLPLADGTGRVAQLVDVRALSPTAPGVERDVAADRASLASLALFVRRFCEPPLAPDHDLQPLGERYLAVLAGPEQIAFVERMIATAKAHQGEPLLVECRILSLTDASFQKHLAPFLPATAVAPRAEVVTAEPKLLGFLFQQGESSRDAARVAILGPGQMQPLFKLLTADAATDLLQAPSILVLPLQSASIAVGEDVAYVKDYELDVVDGRLEPRKVMGSVFDGVRIDATCGLIDADRIALEFALQQQVLVRPIAEFRTTLAQSGDVAIKATIEVPSSTGCRTEQSLVLPLGASAVVAAKNGEGTWCVTTVTVTQSNGRSPR